MSDVGDRMKSAARWCEHKFDKKRQRVADLCAMRREEKAFRAIYDKHADYTLVSAKAYIGNLRLIRAALRREALAEGCIVECGTWAGGMTFGMIDACPEIAEFHCFDSFEGLPPATEADGEVARASQDARAMEAGNVVASIEEFNRGLGRFDAATRAKVHVHKGWFQDTLPEFRPHRPIAVLRLDGDWYESTMVALDHLYDLVADQGLIILDDYISWDGCARAVHDFLSKRQGRERIQQAWPGPVSYMDKNWTPMDAFFRQRLEKAKAAATVES
ncbi:MAG: class I SAM-dependent methyltransferase [Rhodospirillales bacterium]|nr:class I SAM-dependent methyltransferase [Rhodospirillales bacterium]